KSPERSKKLSEKLKGHPALTAPKSEEWKKKASIAAKNRKTVMVECDVCGRVMSNRMIARHKRGKQCQK
ncbi:MAG: hypothetical protein N0C84_01015, partial [Candidatus Thiodiazotropha taylori]|nr:hypothetical protein [Candidatus Thiodiazotropha taylori]MCW4255026.1 hypothetical protein [Candidatus Thiodiazotropha taylori]